MKRLKEIGGNQDFMGSSLSFFLDQRKLIMRKHEIVDIFVSFEYMIIRPLMVIIHPLRIDCQLYFVNQGRLFVRFVQYEESSYE